MKTEHYLGEILLSRGSLQFTGLGTLRRVKKTSGVNQGKFEPPVYYLEFSREESVDDADYLADAIRQGEDITMEEARQQVLEYIDAIQFSFNKGEAFSIEGICSLSLTEDNEVQVEMHPDFVPDPENYGLESFVLDDSFVEDNDEDSSGQDREQIEFHLDMEEDMSKFEETYIRSESDKNKEEKGDSPQEKDKDKTEEPEQQKVMDEEFIEKNEASDDPEDKKDNQETPASIPDFDMPEGYKKRGGILLWVVSGVAAIFALIFVVYETEILTRTRIVDPTGMASDSLADSENLPLEDISEEDFGFDEMLRELRNETDSMTRMENALKPGETPTEMADQSKPDDNTTELSDRNQDIAGSDEAQKPTEIQGYKEYHIVAGSFRSIKNAKELQQKLTLQGYPSLILQPGNGIYRVSAISFRDKTQALNELVNFREKTGMDSAWLMNLD